MNNFIEYFYGIRTDKVVYNDNYYSFIYNGFIYKLYIYNENISLIDFLYNTNRVLVRNTLMSEIIINRNNEILSNYRGVLYILIKVYVNVNKDISLDEISFISKAMYKDGLNINWGMLWSKKIDYLEDLINENGKKYPLIVDSFNYFVGLAENAISYYNTINIERNIESNYKYVVSHKIIKYDDMVEVLYNPMNITFDYKVRDVAEYIKNAFFKNKQNIFAEIVNYLRNNNLSLIEIKLLIARLLYPSFYFELYEDILVDNKEEKIILNVISKIDDYEVYLASIISFFKRYYDIEEIDWLKNGRLD